MVYLSIIIPAYNEERRVVKTVRSVHDFLARQGYTYEIIIVNDGSRDLTVNRVRQLMNEIPHLILINNTINRGKGYAVHCGMRAATGDVRLFMDADNSTRIEELDKALPLIREDSIVIASRRMKGATIAIHQPWYRDFLGGIFRAIVKIVVPVGVTDSQTGFKVFSRTAAEIIFSRQTIHRWAFDVELLVIARTHHIAIHEIPITWMNDAESHVTLRGMVGMLKELITIRWHMWCDKYAQ